MSACTRNRAPNRETLLSYLLAHMMQQLPAMHKVHDEVDLARGLEGIMQRGHERMAHASQDVALGQGVAHVVGLQQELLAQHLHGVHCSSAVPLNLKDLSV